MRRRIKVINAPVAAILDGIQAMKARHSPGFFVAHATHGDTGGAESRHCLFHGTQAKRNIMLILFIDDDPDDYLIFCDALNEINPQARCQYKENGPTALAFLQEELVLPNYIFLDINMPGMDGAECLRRIKKDERLKDIPVIIFSTSLTPDEKHDYKQLGADESFVKPSRFDEIINFLKALGKQ